jgi:large subunit ribosomal protein L25
MQAIKVQAEERTNNGKGISRQLRAAGKIPAVFYGKGKTTTSLSVSPKELKAAVTGEFGVNTVIELEFGGRSYQTLLIDYQYHPVTRELLHADFYNFDEDRTVDVEVPLEMTGKPKGIILGGRLRQVFLRLPIRCRAKDIPAKLVHDVTELGVEDMFRVKDLALPAGVEVRYGANQTLGGVYGNRRKQGEEEEEAAAAPAAGAAATKSAAPAAKAAPGKK